MWGSALRITHILSSREKAAALEISDWSELRTEGHRASKSTEDDRVPEERASLELRPVDQMLKEPSMKHPEAVFLGHHSQGSIPGSQQISMESPERFPLRAGGAGDNS